MKSSNYVYSSLLVLGYDLATRSTRETIATHFTGETIFTLGDMKSSNYVYSPSNNVYSG